MRTRVFQFKLLKRIIYTNTFETLVGFFCGDSEHYLKHLFKHCQFTNNFWTQITDWLNSTKLNVDRLNDADIIFGYTKTRPQWTLVNHIIIVSKQGIHQKRLRGTKPEVSQFI